MPAVPEQETSTYHEIRSAALFREMERDPAIFLVGGVVTIPGVNPETPVDRRFPGRVVWTSIAEFSSMSIGTGAAMAGLRPFVPIGTASFMFYGWPAVTLEAPNVRYLTGGRLTAPVVFHALTGLRRGSGTDHEHSPQAMLQQIPGLRIYAPGTPAEIDGVMHAAFTGNDPTLILDHKALAAVRASVPTSRMNPDTPYLVRPGDDAIVVAHSYMLRLALAAAERLAAAGCHLAVLSTPLLNPAPVDAIIEQIKPFHRVVLVDEAREPGSFASFLAGQLLQRGTAAQVRLVTTRHAPSPSAYHLGEAIIPTVERIIDAVFENHRDVQPTANR